MVKAKENKIQAILLNATTHLICIHTYGILWKKAYLSHECNGSSVESNKNGTGRVTYIQKLTQYNKESRKAKIVISKPFVKISLLLLYQPEFRKLWQR